MTTELPASYVITQQCIASPFVIINLYIVIKEIHKRLRHEVVFKSYSSKWLSFVCIAAGALYPFTWVMHYFTGFCYFMSSISSYIGYGLPISVGLYQLSRLRQCFSDNKVPNGYPKWLFQVLTTFGIMYLLALIPFLALNDTTDQCGLTHQYDFWMIERGWGYRSWAIFDSIMTAIYLIWDMTTLLLLVFKLRFLTESVSVKSHYLVTGIRRNMTRIVILTIFYMMIKALDAAWYFYFNYYEALPDWRVPSSICNIVDCLSTTAMSYAVFLMEPHNSSEYALFLKRVICLKLYLFCCCYRNNILDQRDYFLLKYDAICGGTAPRQQLEQLVPREKTNTSTGTTAFNEFSLNERPSFVIGYTAPLVPLRVSQNGKLELPIVVEGNVACTSSLNALEEGHGDILRNDFLFQSESRAETHISSEFSFGVYLEYWRRHKHNSVVPKYDTLREELTMNRHATITTDQYDELYRDCTLIRQKLTFLAKDIGIMNKVCGIEPGSEMTMEHVICVKLYTDFTNHQNMFKKHCRRLYKEETLESVMQRNREIGHWCRLLRECIMFYGDSMSASEVVYCGLNARLIFRSLHQRFECPLSTTESRTVARQFAKEGYGIVLKLKRSNPKTRYLDVTRFSCFNHENERLFSGSTLKIVDISIGLQSLKRYINAIRMLEQIANGHFIDFGEQTGMLLLSLLHRVIADSVVDVLRHGTIQIIPRCYLEEEAYDTDAVLDDIEIVDDSNVFAMVVESASNILKLIKDTLGTFCAPHSIFLITILYIGLI